MTDELDASEAQFQQQIMQLAATCGWDCHHIRPGKYGSVYKTDGLPGMPDLLLIGQRGQGVFFAELKTRTGKVSAQQEHRITQLLSNGCEVHIWRPQDLDRIVSRLKNRKPKQTDTDSV